MPLIELTSDVRVDLKGVPRSPTQLEKVGQAYESWHRQIAAQSQQGREFVVPGSTSSKMTVDHATAVISAIGEVVQKSRHSRS